MKDKTGILEALQNIDSGVLSPKGFKAVWDAIRPLVEEQDNYIAGLMIENINLKLAAKKHPEQAEGAQGEREAFEAHFYYLSHERYVDGTDQYASEFENGAWLAWQARAALAQPSPAPELDDELALLRSVLNGYSPSMARADGLRAVSAVERIVGALRAEIAEIKGGMAYRNSLVGRLEEERAAAQARVAELEKQEPVATVCEVSMHHTGSTDVINTHLPCGTKLYAAPVAQAGQVPEGYALVPLEPLINMMSDKDHDTRITAERQLLAMLAAAPAQGGE